MKNSKDPLILIREIRSGGSEAFDELCEKYSPLIGKICGKYSGTLESDDIRQICALKLHEAVFAYRDDRNVTFGSYAAACMENAVISEIRKSKVRSRPEEETSAVQEVASPEDALIARERSDELIRLIRVELSPYEREVFGMYYAGKSYAEMARLTGKSERSVGTAIMRAKAKLRKIK